VLLPQYVMGKRWYAPEWEPLWEAIEDAGIPISFHVGFSRWMLAGLDMWEGNTEASFVMVSLNMAEIISEFIFGGPRGPILERHPGITMVMTECSAGWLAWVMEFLDYTWSGRHQELSKRQAPGHPTLAAPPSYYIKRQVKATFMWDRVAIHNRSITGTDCGVTITRTTKVPFRIRTSGPTSSSVRFRRMRQGPCCARTPQRSSASDEARGPTAELQVSSPLRTLTPGPQRGRRTHETAFSVGNRANLRAITGRPSGRPVRDEGRHRDPQTSMPSPRD
jgi:hypothetical protein